MGTTSDEIFDLFMMRIFNDTTLNTLYTTSGSTVATVYAEPWLLDSIDRVVAYCPEDLSYTVSDGTSVGYFTATLSREMKNILSHVMVLSWLQRQVMNQLAFSRFVQDRDFRMSAPMLPSLQNALILKTEEIDKLLSDYSYRHVPWTEWQNGNFSASAIA